MNVSRSMCPAVPVRAGLLTAVLMLGTGCAGLMPPPPPPASCPETSATADAPPPPDANPYGASPTGEGFQADLQLPDPALYERLAKEIEKSTLPADLQKQRLGEIESLRRLAELARDLDRHALSAEKGDRDRWTALFRELVVLVKLRTSRLTGGSTITETPGEVRLAPQTGSTVRSALWQAVEAKDDGRVLALWDNALRELPEDELPLDMLPEVARAAARTGSPERAANYLESFLESLRYPDLPVLTMELAGYYAATGDTLKAKDSYERVVARVEDLAPLAPRAKSNLQTLDQQAKDESAKLRAKLIQAEAIFAYGTDYPAAHRLIADVLAESKDPQLQERAQKLIEGFRQRRIQLLNEDLTRLRADYIQGRVDPAGARQRASGLRTKYPEPDLQPLITSATLDLDVQQGKASADRAALDRQKLAAADLAIKDGRYSEAVIILRELSVSPTEGGAALQRLIEAIDGIVKKQRDRSGDAVARAMKLKDPSARRDALVAVQKQLGQLLTDYPDTTVRPLIEKDIRLLESQIQKLAPPPAPAQQ